MRTKLGGRLIFAHQTLLLGAVDGEAIGVDEASARLQAGAKLCVQSGLGGFIEVMQRSGGYDRVVISAEVGGEIIGADDSDRFREGAAGKSGEHFG